MYYLQPIDKLIQETKSVLVYTLDTQLEEFFNQSLLNIYNPSHKF